MNGSQRIRMRPFDRPRWSNYRPVGAAGRRCARGRLVTALAGRRLGVAPEAFMEMRLPGEALFKRFADLCVWNRRDSTQPSQRSLRIFSLRRRNDR